MLSVVHRIAIEAPHTHLVHVETTITGPLPPELVLFMPIWTPGSYLVREYARHVETLTVDTPGHGHKIRKNAWRIRPVSAERVVVRTRIYGNELTVRTNHVDDSHAFLVGAALFLGIEGHETLGARVEIKAPAGWRVATALPATADGAFVAADFDTLIDAPIEVGMHREERFEAAGKPHRYAIWPAAVVSDSDVTRLVDDTRTILHQEARLFGGALPYDAYELLLHLSPRGRGGLEHNASVALIAAPTAFQSRDGYLDLLSLIAHEALHAWNVKRIRPQGLFPYRYQEECYTRLLWWFEGGTSYYDWRVLRLCRLCTVEEYLEHLATEIGYLDQTPGRLVQSLEDASFDAWIKLYRPDENSGNSAISYYRKGELVCALLDIEIRARSGGKASLDRVLAALWEEFGSRGRPVPEDGMQGIFERAAGVPLGDLFDAWIRAPGDLDFAATFTRVGLVLERSTRTEGPTCALGVRVRAEGGRATVATVTRDSAAFRAGIDPGDELVAIGGMRIEGTNIDAALRGRAPGDVVEVQIARDGRMLQRRAALDPPRHDKVKLLANREALPAAQSALTAWLGEPHPAWAAPAAAQSGTAASGGTGAP
jgi:predicted metalloprotease with PDZ domain